MTTIIGERAHTKKEYRELAEAFLSENPNTIKLWEKQAKDDEHSRKLYEAGLEYLSTINSK